MPEESNAAPPAVPVFPCPYCRKSLDEKVDMIADHGGDFSDIQCPHCHNECVLRKSTRIGTEDESLKVNLRFAKEVQLQDW